MAEARLLTLLPHSLPTRRGATNPHANGSTACNGICHGRQVPILASRQCCNIRGARDRARMLQVRSQGWRVRARAKRVMVKCDATRWRSALARDIGVLRQWVHSTDGARCCATSSACAKPRESPSPVRPSRYTRASPRSMIRPATGRMAAAARGPRPRRVLRVAALYARR